MKKKKYTMSEDRLHRDMLQANWENRITVLRLRNQGHTYASIARDLGLTRQRVEQIYRRMSGITVDEAEKITKSLE